LLCYQAVLDRKNREVVHDRELQLRRVHRVP
jgi:hypothetical protein